MTKEINEAKCLLKSMEEIYADNLSKEIAENGIHVVKSHTNQSIFKIIGNLQDKIDNADDALEHLRYAVSDIATYPYFHGASTEFKSSIPAENAESRVETITGLEPVSSDVLNELEQLKAWMGNCGCEERLAELENAIATLAQQAVALERQLNTSQNTNFKTAFRNFQ